ncbi:MAG: GTPase [Bacillota bacterium]|jgi:small GTP-binding protein
MPANLTPQYMEAEEAYKRAITPEEKIDALEEMLRTIPKHKGTDKMQADIKRRIARLKEAGEAARKKGRPDPYRVEREGAGQVFVVGPPNSGKSALVGRLTNARVVVASYPFATVQPVPGMMKYEDILIQLVDTPPVLADNCPPALVASIRSGDAVLMVVDASSDSCLDDVQDLLDLLEERRVINQGKPHMAVLSKIDLPDAADNAEILLEAYPDISFVTVSAESREGLEELPRILFDMLDIIRLYSKPPGRDVDRAAPFVLKRGGTVAELAGAIHRDLPRTMKSARVWGSARFDGQPVPREYVLSDGDVVEFRT